MAEIPTGSNLLINKDSEHWLCVDRLVDESLNERSVNKCLIEDVGNQPMVKFRLFYLNYSLSVCKIYLFDYLARR